MAKNIETRLALEKTVASGDSLDLGVNPKACARKRVKRGLPKSDSPQGKVRFGLPQHALRFVFPRLWLEAEAAV